MLLRVKRVMSKPAVQTGLAFGAITAVRAYEANIRVKENFQRMAERALRLAE